MTAMERLDAAHFKINTVLAQRLGAALFEFSAAADKPARDKVFSDSVSLWMGRFNVINEALKEARNAVKLVTKLAGEQDDIPLPWGAIENLPDAEVLNVLEKFFVEADGEDDDA